MKRRLLTIALVLILAFSITTSALAQSYSFSLDKEVVNVYWNADGTMSLDYLFTFTNQPGAHVIDFVDVGLPNNSYIYNTIQADVSGDPVAISTDYQGSGSGIAVDMGSHAIQPGQTGTVHVFVGQISDVYYPDDNDENYASAVFSPTWFDGQFVVGDTDITVTFHLPRESGRRSRAGTVHQPGFPPSRKQGSTRKAVSRTPGQAPIRQGPGNTRLAHPSPKHTFPQPPLLRRPHLTSEKQSLPSPAVVRR
jgi:hypothetical protein